MIIDPEIKKCEDSFEYFFDNYSGLNPDEKQKTQGKNMCSVNRSVLLSPRRNGVTTLAKAYITWKLLFGRDENIYYCSHNGASRSMVLNGIICMCEELQKRFNFEIVVPNNGTVTVNDCRVSTLDINRFEYVFLGSRGQTVIVDNAEYIDYKLPISQIWERSGYRLKGLHFLTTGKKKYLNEFQIWLKSEYEKFGFDITIWNSDKTLEEKQGFVNTMGYDQYYLEFGNAWEEFLLKGS